RRLAKNQITPAVCLPGLNDSEVGLERAFHYMRTPVKLAHLFAFSHHGACARWGKEGGDPCAAGADPLRQRALRVELQLNLAAQPHLLENFVLADVRANVLLDLPVEEELAETIFIDARVVRNRCEIPNAFSHQRLNKIFGDPAQPESADHEHSAI